MLNGFNFPKTCGKAVEAAVYIFRNTTCICTLTTFADISSSLSLSPTLQSSSSSSSSPSSSITSTTTTTTKRQQLIVHNKKKLNVIFHWVSPWSVNLVCFTDGKRMICGSCPFQTLSR